MSGGCRIVSRSATHAGLVRPSNQDAVLAVADAGLWAVADGMGGHSQGERASAAIIERLEHLACFHSGAELVARIPAALDDTNRLLVDAAARTGPDTVIGSTVVVLVLEADNFHCFWAGDSRIYLWRDGTLRQLTRDHVEAPDARLTRAVGADTQIDVDYHADHLYEGDLFLLCSDGLSKMLSDGQLRDLLDAYSAFEVCEVLLSAALRAGGRDNVSCVTVGLVPTSR